jgi:hypothetical protein
MSLLNEGEKIWVGEEYAGVTWRAEDVSMIKPNWSMPKCEEWLQDNEEHIAERLTELGWEVLDAFLMTEDDDE